VSLARTVLAELLRFGAEKAANALEGDEPSPEEVARELAAKGVKLVGVEVMRQFLTPEAAARIDAEVDAEMEEKLRRD